MSDSSENSPLSSPLREPAPRSPATSPNCIISPPTSPGSSPPTSPAYASSSDDSDSDASHVSIHGVWRKRKGQSKRTRRRQRRRMEAEAQDEDINEDMNAEESARDSPTSQARAENSMTGDEVLCDDREVASSVGTFRAMPALCVAYHHGPDSETSSSDESGLSVHDMSESDSDDSVSLDSVNEESGGEEPISDDNAEAIEYIFDGSTLTANEALLKVLKLFVEERWTKRSLDRNLKLIKGMLPQPNGLPTSGTAALKKLELLTSSCSETEYLLCNKCLQIVGACDHNEGVGKFYSFPIDYQIKHMLENRSLAAAIDSYHGKWNSSDSLCDITSGSEFKRIKAQYPSEWELFTLLWNTDGVQLSASSKQELWPILCTICEVPPRLRSSFLVVAGIYVGEKKPDMNVYLKPFRCAMQELWVSGLSWKHPDTQEQHSTKVIAPVLCADAPARAIVLCTKNYNSRFGCNCCEQKSKKIDLTPEEIEFNTNNNTDRRKMKRRKRRLLFEEVPAVLRTGPRMDLLGQMAQARGKSRKGVLGVAEVSVIPHFDRAASVSAEYLHLILLGVCKYFLNLIFLKPGPWYLGAKLDEIEDFIADIKVPDYVKRLPRKINDMKFWKASEFRAFLLFYSLPIFKQHWKQQYLEHLLLLVQATYILLQDCITEDDLNAAEIMIQSFVRDICGLYNYACYTYNVHTLLHLPLLVRRWGPLWATSAFVFESYNAYIANHVHGTKHIGKELINNIKIAQSVATLDNIVNAPTLNYLPQQIANVMLGKSLATDSINDEEKRTLNSCATLGTYVLHSRAKLGDHTGMFTTRVYDKNKKRANSFMQFKEEDGNNAYGQMLYFIKAEDTSFHCLVNVLKINHVNLIFHAPSRYIVKHLVPFEGTNLLRVIPVECILQKTLKIGSYLAIPPNSFEINL